MNKVLSLFISCGLVIGQQATIPPRTFQSPSHRDQFLTHPPSELVAQQPAATMTITLSSDQVTMLEKFRVDSGTNDPAKTCTSDATGMVKCTPAFATINDLGKAILTDFLKRISQDSRYTPLPAKAAAKAAQAAQKAAQDMIDSTIIVK